MEVRNPNSKLVCKIDERFLFCIISFIITIFVVLNKNERKSFMLLFQNLLNKIR